MNRKVLFSFLISFPCVCVFSSVFAQTAFKNTGSSTAAAAENQIATIAGKDKTAKQRTAKRWKQTYTLKEFYRLGMLPANVNFSFSGEITKFRKNPDNTVTVFLFSSFSVQLADKVKGDLPVNASVRVSHAEFERLALRENARKSWILDGNYVLIYKTADNVVIHAMDNSLTPEPETKDTKR